MEVSLCNLRVASFHCRPTVVFPVKTQATSSVLILSPPAITCARLKLNRPEVFRCVSSGGCVAEIERKLESEMNPEDGEEWLNLKSGKLTEKCGGEKGGAIELLECLEREAIMGEDEGRDPIDYDRRAKIFSTSSKVFKALKQHNDASPD